MDNRRTKRSPHPDEALQLLIEALADRSEVRAVALVNARGRVLAAAGDPTDVAGIARIAASATREQDSAEFERVTRDTDFFARTVEVHGATVYLGALGTRMRRLTGAVEGIARIVASPSLRA